jgi:hypothetical protein
MLIGKIAKDEGPLWGVEIEAIGAWTQGRSRRDAEAMLVDLVETMLETELNRKGKVTVTEIGNDGPNSYTVLVEASEPALLAALLLKYQRTVHRLTLAQVAKMLGTANHNAYASYEQGRREPSLSKFRELLATVAPEMALTVGRRAPKSAPPKRKAAKATKAKAG